jgi:GH15 family glucan-1,4-alpha-glucosidase
MDPDGGSFGVGTPDGDAGLQKYIPNTNCLETRFTTRDGSFRVLDFAPRFTQYDRSFRPTQLFRIIEPLDGTPRVAIRCEPRLGWSKKHPITIPGSNHFRFEGFPAELRLTTDVPLSYLDGRPIALTQKHYLALTWGQPIEESLAPLAERFYADTVRYWQRWVKHCTIPPLYQDEVIRSALALKLHCFEDTGAIIAAMTTSLSEAPGSQRNWDYRYCWLRDAYYSLAAFRMLGHFEEREQFLHYLLNIAASSPALNLAPLYRVDGRADLTESVVDNWSGWKGERPVRIGNAANAHEQHDIFGEMVLALAPIYLDERFEAERSRHTLDLLVRLSRKAAAVAGTPDAGIWEYREDWRPQTFSSLMCWAATDRMARVASKHSPLHEGEFREAATRIKNEMLEKAWNEKVGAFVMSYEGSELDASLLQMPMLHFLPSHDARLRRTVHNIRDGLSLDLGWLKRYKGDFIGSTQVAFTICTFWLVEALARIGDKVGARETFDRARQILSPLGLISEDIDPTTKRMWGNFPQAYSHVGLIHAAFAASPAWSDP